MKHSRRKYCVHWLGGAMDGISRRLMDDGWHDTVRGPPLHNYLYPGMGSAVCTMVVHGFWMGALRFDLGA